MTLSIFANMSAPFDLYGTLSYNFLLDYSYNLSDLIQTKTSDKRMGSFLLNDNVSFILSQPGQSTLIEMYINKLVSLIL
jgi:hypothetical protein